MVTIYINGQRYEAKPGQMIIEVADAAGIAIPRFCYHKKLSIAANCRMCLVEVAHSKKTLPACATPVAEGMEVQTCSLAAKRSQQAVMEFLLINHPLDCPICDQGGECELQDVAMTYGQNDSKFSHGKRAVGDEDLGPLIATHMTRCIHCTRCVRFGVELAGIQELGATDRGEHMRIGTYVQHSLQSEVSGNMIDLCPVGALTSKPYQFQARAWELKETAYISPHDSLGAHLSVHSLRDRIFRVVPRSCETLNETWLSDRDRFSYLGLTHSDRLHKPMIKVDGQWQEVNWPRALSYAASGLKKVLAHYGPEQIGALIASSVSLEELFGLQHLMRGLGSPHIDHRLRQLDMTDQQHWPLVPVLPAPYATLEQSDCIVLIGCNLQAELPLAMMRVRKAVRRGAQVWVLNLDVPELYVDIQEQWIAHPKQLGLWLEAILYRVTDGQERPEAARFEPLCQALRRAKAPVLLLGAQAQQHPQASVLRYLSQALAKAIGGQVWEWPAGSNAVGAWAMGAVPHRLPGGIGSEHLGLDARAMCLASLKSYLFYGFEPELDMVHASCAVTAFKKADWVIGCTSFRSPAMLDYSDVLLPIAAFTEYSGTMINLEGTVESFAAAVPPPAAVQAGWQVLQTLSEQLGLACYQNFAELQQAIHEHLPPLHYEPVVWPQPSLIIHASPALQPWSEWSIYQGDGLTRRSSALQQTPLAAQSVVRLNTTTLKAHHLTSGSQITVAIGGAQLTWPLRIDERVPDQVVILPAGLPEAMAVLHLGEAIELLEVRDE